MKQLLDVQNPKGTQVEVVESVCSVERLHEVCQMSFNTIPVVNMAGRVIGLIPKSFIVVLIENHWWYNEDITIKRHKTQVTNFYRTAMSRQESIRLSQRDQTSEKDPQSPTSPVGSILDEDDERQGKGTKRSLLHQRKASSSMAAPKFDHHERSVSDVA